MSERKPCLEWETIPGCEDLPNGFNLWVPATQQLFKVDYSRLIPNGWYFSLRGLRSETYRTSDAAKLACEDHLRELLKPLAETYEKLEKNR